jgi:hypothetical protein
MRLSVFVSKRPEICELDINPLIVYPKAEVCVVAERISSPPRRGEAGPPEAGKGEGVALPDLVFASNRMLKRLGECETHGP